MNKNIKNYLFLSGLIIVTFVICLYVFSWIKQYNDAKLKEPIITSVVAEVKYDNLDSFLKERELFILYVCTSSEKTCRNFEKKFKRFLIDENITDYVVYFNLGERKVEDNVLNRIYKEYKHEDLKKKIYSYPSLLVFSKGKIIDLLSPNDENDISINTVKQFLEGYEL